MNQDIPGRYLFYVEQAELLLQEYCARYSSTAGTGDEVAQFAH
jgi:hypothetical protein